LRRHPTLRAACHGHGQRRPVPVIPHHEHFAWREPDLSALHESDRRAALDRLEAADRDRRFDLTRAPLMRMALIRLAPDRHRLLLWSGRDERDEARVRGELLSVLDGSHSEAFPALPTAVPCGTPPGPVRGAAVTVSALAAASVHKAQPVRTGRPRQIALLFPGQGSQHTGMATGLYRRDPVFTAAVDAVFAHMGEEGRRVREDWLTPGPPRIPVDDVRRAQPLLFAVDYALGRL
nr:condensation domain-containing protein [Streptomyces sp. DSM 41633]